MNVLKQVKSKHVYSKTVSKYRKVSNIVHLSKLNKNLLNNLLMVLIFIITLPSVLFIDSKGKTEP